MHAFIEESGRYSFQVDRGFESSVLLGLLVPDLVFEEMKTFVPASCERWNRRELKGSRLKPKQVMEVADFLATQPIAAVAFVTDNQVMTEEVVTHHRSWQASLVAQARDAYGRRTDASDERLAAATATIELVGVGMSDVEFAQRPAADPR